MTPELREMLFPLIGALAGGVGAYVAIRSALADLQARMLIVERTADKAHARLDDVLSVVHGRRSQ